MALGQADKASIPPHTLSNSCSRRRSPPGALSFAILVPSFARASASAASRSTISRRNRSITASRSSASSRRPCAISWEQRGGFSLSRAQNVEFFFYGVRAVIGLWTASESSARAWFHTAIQRRCRQVWSALATIYVPWIIIFHRDNPIQKVYHDMFLIHAAVTAHPSDMLHHNTPLECLL